ADVGRELGGDQLSEREDLRGVGYRGWHWECKRSGIDLSAAWQEIHFDLGLPVSNRHLGTRVRLESVQRELFDREFDIRHDDIHVYGKSRIPMFLHGKPTAHVVRNLE